MGLITKEVIQKWHPNNRKHYELKGYIFTNWKDEFFVKVEDLTDGSSVFVDVKCDGFCENNILNIIWGSYKINVKENNKYYCNKCANILFGYSGKNKITNEQIHLIVNERLGWKVLEVKIINAKTCIDLMDDDGYKYGNVYIYNIKKLYLPEKFHQSNIYTTENINNWLKLNNANIKLINEYKKAINNLKWKCLDCNNIFERTWHKVKSGQTSCPHCGDGISYPEKFMRSLLEQLKIEYEYQYNPNWIKPQRYDFYINNKDIIIETDGDMGHGNNDKLRNLTSKETKAIDDYKDRKAKEHGVEVIRIDAKKSEMEYIRDNILNSKLNEIFNLNEVNWLKCHEMGCKSLVKIASDLWKNGIKSTAEIGKILKLSRNTIAIYLNNGANLNLCNYSIKESRKASGVKIRARISKPIIQLTLNDEFIKEFSSMHEAEKQTGIKHSGISMCCNNKLKTAGGYKWMFKTDYKQLEY